MFLGLKYSISALDELRTQVGFQGVSKRIGENEEMNVSTGASQFVATLHSLIPCAVFLVLR